MSELRQLEQEIAYSSARSDIECYCTSENVGGVTPLWWYDITSAESDEEQEWVTMAVRYLELRGLLLRHPENATLVRPLSAPEGDKVQEPGGVMPDGKEYREVSA